MPIHLFLDDERPCPPGWVLARTVDEAKGIAKGGDVSRMSLDHDLGGSVSAHGGTGVFNPGTQTGMDFVRWMAKTRNWPQQKPAVHSANFHGGQSMRALIDRAGPYMANGIRVQTPSEPGIHLPGPHIGCSDPHCCRCDCDRCTREWEASGMPTERDCQVHGGRR